MIKAVKVAKTNSVIKSATEVVIKTFRIAKNKTLYKISYRSGENRLKTVRIAKNKTLYKISYRSGENRLKTFRIAKTKPVIKV